MDRYEAFETIARGEDILDQVKEVARAIDERVHHVMDMDADDTAGSKSDPNPERT